MGTSGETEIHFNNPKNCQKLKKVLCRHNGGRGIEGFAGETNGRNAGPRRWWWRSTAKSKRKTRTGHGHEEQYSEPSFESGSPCEIEYIDVSQTRERCSSRGSHYPNGSNWTVGRKTQRRRTYWSFGKICWIN